MSVPKKHSIPLSLDTSEFEKGLSEVKKNANDLRKEINKVNRQLKFDGDNTELLADKQQLLKRRMNETAKEIEEVKKIQKLLNEQQEKGYKVSESVIRKYNIQLSKSETSLKSMKREYENINDPLYKMKRELADIERLLKLDPNNVELLSKKMTLLKDSSYKTKEELKQLRIEKRIMDENFRKGQLPLEEYNNFNEKINKLENSYKQLRAEENKTKKSLYNVKETFTEIGGGIENLGATIEGVGSKLIKNITAPLLALGTGSVVIGMDFEASKSAVQALTGESYEAMEVFETKARELGASTKYSAKMVMDAFQKIALAGWNMEEAVAGIDGILSLATAGDNDIAVVADIITDTMAAFGAEAKESEKYADIIAKTMTSTNTDILMMGEALKYVAPLASSMNFEMDELSIAIGMMANQGVKASQAGTALRATFARLASPTKDMSEAMNELGINILDDKGDVRSLLGIIDELRKGFEGLSEVEQIDLAKTLFGMEASTGMLTIINTTEQEYRKLTKSIKDSDGASKEMANTMQKNLKGQLTSTKSAVEELSLKIYKELEPSLTKNLGKFQNFVDKLNDMEKGSIKSTVEVGALATAIPILTLVTGKTISTAGKLVTTLTRMHPAIAVTTGAVTALTAVWGIAKIEQEKYINSFTDGIREERNSIERRREGYDNLINDTVENIEKMVAISEKYDTSKELIEKHNTLRKQSKLTADEFLKYLELESAISNGYIIDPEKVTKFEDEMEKLIEKSGLTREEFRRMVEVNDSLVESYDDGIEKTGQYKTAIFQVGEEMEKLALKELQRELKEQTNIVKESINEVSKFSQDMPDIVETLYETKVDIVYQEDNHRKVLDRIEEIKSNLEDIKDYEKELQELAKDRREFLIELNDMNLGKEKLEYQRGDMSNDEYNKRMNEYNGIIQELELQMNIDEKRSEQLKTAIKNKELLKQELKELKEYEVIRGNTISENEKLLGSRQQFLDDYSESVKKLMELEGYYIEIFENISGTKVELGKEKASIEQYIKELEKSVDNEKNTESKELIQNKLDILKDILDIYTSHKDELSKQYDLHEEIMELQDNGLDKEKEAIDKINTLRGSSLDQHILKINEFNEKSGKTVNKDIKVKYNKDPDLIDEELSKDVEKSIFIKFKDAVGNFIKNPFDIFGNKDSSASINAYKDGTNFHKGGKALIGEEGKELVKLPNGKSFLADLGVYNIPVGTKVFTHDETSELFRNNLGNTLINGINFKDMKSDINNHIVIDIKPANININGEKVGELIYDDINERISLENENKFLLGDY